MKSDIRLGVVTTNRADYGLLKPLIDELSSDSYFDLKLLVTGSHYSSKHGYTVGQILDDGVSIDYGVDIVPVNDTEDAISKVVGESISAFSNIYSKTEFDGIIVLGDRYELWGAVIPAVIHKIPIIHIHGGEATEGLIDDPVRHSITKMASIHFPSMKVYGKRIRQMGERSDRVHVVGALGIDNIMKLKRYSKQELEEELGVSDLHNVALMTYHPVTLDQYEHAGNQIKEVLEALLSRNIKTLITMPNTDTGSNQILEVVEKYVKKYPDQLYLYSSLGQKRYLSAMSYVAFMIGNSSSGILESASFKLPVINVGDRQKGRVKPLNIIDVPCKKEYLEEAIDYVCKECFRKKLINLENPYGSGNAAQKIKKILKKIDFSDKNSLLKKGFVDIKIEGG